MLLPVAIHMPFVYTYNSQLSISPILFLQNDASKKKMAKTKMILSDTNTALFLLKKLGTGVSKR
jgi:hypothetical protein